MEKNIPEIILVHCTDHPRSKLSNQYDACNQWHKDRDFPMSSLGKYIGYHSLITGERNYSCRFDTDEGAHCNQKINGVSLNFRSLAVAIGFDGDVEYPTKMETALLQKQIWEWQDKYGISNENVKFHRDFSKDKTCPGSLITRAWLDELLARPTAVDVSPKPVEKMCIAEEKQIENLRVELSFMQKWFQWFVENFS